MMYERNDYLSEGGTQLLATHCVLCGQLLRDPESVERGVGPYCAEKSGMFAAIGPVDEGLLAHALSTSPPALAEAVRAKLDDPRSAVSAAIHAAGYAWQHRSSDQGHYLGSAIELATALGYGRTARALQSVFIGGQKYDEDGNPVGSARPKGVVVTDVGGGRWQIELPYLESRPVWSQTNDALKAAGARNQKDYQTGRWQTTFPAGDESWLRILNALVATLAGTLGVLPSGETFVVPAERQAVPESRKVEAPAGIGSEQAVQQQPGRLPKDASELQAGDHVFLHDGKEMVVAWISGDRVRAILLTPEAAAKSLKEKGFLHGKAYGGITVGLRDVEVTPPTAREVAAVEVATAAQPPAGAPAPSPLRELPANLMAHQREGAMWLWQQGSGILAFEQGLGKTATAIVAAEYPALIVCPKSLKTNWIREVAMWRPDLTAVSIEPGKRREEATLEAAKTSDVTVINYDILSRHVDELRERGFKTLIVDESHYIKNLQVGPKKDPRTSRWRTVPHGSQRAVAVHNVAQGVPHRYLLSGTPMDNKSPCELFGQLNVVAPVEFPKFKPFGEEYCDPRTIHVAGRTVTTYDGASNTLELHERINGKFLLRRTKELLDLPEKWRRTKLISLDEAHAKEYQAAARDLFKFIRERGGWEALERAQKAEVLVRMTTLSHLTGIGKVEAFVEEVQQHWESTHRPLLIFAQHADVQTKVFDALAALGYRVGAITGGMSASARQDVVDRFQRGVPESAPAEEREFYDILVLSLTAAREGLTLTRAQDVLFIERTWSPFHLVQAEDRAHRIGQKNAVTVTYYDAPGTLDEKFGQMLLKKLATAKGVLEGVSLTQEDAAAEIFGSLTEMQANGASAPPVYPDWIDPE